MKQLYTTLFAVIAIVQFSYAQNTSWSTSGSIGIGTISPAAKLHLTEDATSTGATALKLTNRNSNQTWGLAVDVDAVDDKKFMIYDATGNIPRFTINTLGNVGIGTTTPRAQFSVVSGVDNSGTFFPATNAVIVGADNALTSLSSNLAISSNSTAAKDVGASIGLGGRWLGAGDVRDVEFATIKGAKENNTAGDGSGYLVFGTYGVGGMVEKMRVTSSGNLAIGTTDPPQGYKLAVNGNAIAESVTVKLHTAWPDYVFKKDYNLPSLLEVKTYIDQNHHLPEMPSEAQVIKNGVNLGEMVRMQTKKIEELTLYLIEKDRQVTEQQKQLAEQQKVNQSLQEQINQLVKKINK